MTADLLCRATAIACEAHRDQRDKQGDGDAGSRGWSYGPTGTRMHYWQEVGEEGAARRMESLCGRAMLLFGAGPSDGFPRHFSDCLTCVRLYMAKPELHPEDSEAS